MASNALTQLEQELLAILKREYSFYQSLYILLDKQRDIIKYDKEESLLELYTEIERCQRRIKESDTKIHAIHERNSQMFQVATIHPDIKKVTNSIITLVKKNMKLVEENETYARDRHQRIKGELDELRHSQKILRYIGDGDISPQFVDGTK